MVLSFPFFFCPTNSLQDNICSMPSFTSITLILMDIMNIKKVFNEFNLYTFYLPIFEAFVLDLPNFGLLLSQLCWHIMSLCSYKVLSVYCLSLSYCIFIIGYISEFCISLNLWEHINFFYDYKYNTTLLKNSMKGYRPWFYLQLEY